MASAAEHLEELLKLPPTERARVASVLLDSLDGDSDPDAEDAWAVEIERRVAKIQAGETEMVSATDAIARIRRAARGG